MVAASGTALADTKPSTSCVVFNPYRRIIMKQVQKGFTLIELMIVVAIIGILAAVAIPAYQDYVVKAKLSKAAAVVDPLKLALAMYNQEQGSFPSATVTTATAWAAGSLWDSIGLSTLPSTTTEVTAIGIAPNGVITITLGAIKASTINGKVVTMTPSTAGSTAVTWSNACSSGSDAILTKYFACS